MKIHTSTLASDSKNLGAGLVTFKHESATTAKRLTRGSHTPLRFVSLSIQALKHGQQNS